jgi:hypothetical protein
MTGGSDGHHVNHMGKVVTYTRRVKNRAAFLDAIKDNRNWVVGKEIDLFRKMASNSSKIRRNVKNYPHLIEKNVRFSYTLLNTKTRKFRDSVQRKINPRLIIGRKSGADD